MKHEVLYDIPRGDRQGREMDEGKVAYESSRQQFNKQNAKDASRRRKKVTKRQKAKHWMNLFLILIHCQTEYDSYLYHLSETVPSYGNVMNFC